MKRVFSMNTVNSEQYLVKNVLCQLMIAERMTLNVSVAEDSVFTAT